MSFPIRNAQDISSFSQIATIETCAERGVFACGSYELDEGTGQRSGLLQIFNGSGALRLEVATDAGGVLDMKWKEKDCLITAQSVGSLCIYRFTPDSSSVISQTRAERPEEGLFLSVDSVQEKIFVSTQEGSVLIFSLSDSGLTLLAEVNNIHRMLGENMPVWIVAASSFHINSFLTGGDDMTFKMWDFRCLDFHIANLKAHNAGVTSAMFSPHSEHVLATGSYDETLKIWDLRNLKKEVLSINTGGGVWRVKWHPDSAYESCVLSASMQSGVSVFNINKHFPESDFPMPVIDTDLLLKFPEISSEKVLTYGVDWLPVIGDTFRSFLTSSFYERTLTKISF